MFTVNLYRRTPPHTGASAGLDGSARGTLVPLPDTKGRESFHETSQPRFMEVNVCVLQTKPFVLNQKFP